MTTKLKLFFKSLSLYNILIKIFVLFIIGILSRFSINNIYNSTLLIELFSLSLFINQFSFIDYINFKLVRDNINYFKRPRDRVTINNNNISYDHEFKTKFRRKCH